jgi:hypothetical protein
MAHGYTVPKRESDQYLIIVREQHEKEDERYIRDTFTEIPKSIRVVLAQTAEGTINVDDKVIFGTFTVEQAGRANASFLLLTDLNQKPSGIMRYTVVRWGDIWSPEHKKGNKNDE